MQKIGLKDLQRKYLLIELNEWLDQRDIPRNELSAAIGDSESQISRALRGVPGGQSTFQKLCNFAGIDLQKKDPRWSQTLISTLNDVWDGSEDQAKAISALLLAAEHVGRK